MALYLAIRAFIKVFTISPKFQPLLKSIKTLYGKRNFRSKFILVVPKRSTLMFQKSPKISCQTVHKIFFLNCFVSDPNIIVDGKIMFLHS